MKQRICILLLGCVCGMQWISAQKKFPQYESDVYVSKSGDSLLYRSLKPENVAEGKTYPLVLFLHGAGERGSDNEKQLFHGGMLFTNPVNRTQYPAFVLFPQCPEDRYWPTPLRPDGFKDGNPFPIDAEISRPLALVKELLDRTMAEYPVDPRRVYVMGLSMGGIGTFDLVCRYPDLFAAAIPICGGIHTGRLEKLVTSTKFRIYHGDSDSVVPVEFSREAYLALKKAGIEAEYIEFPGIDHGSWNPAFSQSDYLSWLFGQRKPDGGGL